MFMFTHCFLKKKIIFETSPVGTFRVMLRITNINSFKYTYDKSFKSDIQRN